MSDEGTIDGLATSTDSVRLGRTIRANALALSNPLGPTAARPLPSISGEGMPPARAGERSCGACAACCTTCAVDALAKPAYRTCADVRPAQGTRGRCGRYDSRPAECGTYACVWLLGFVGETRDRPDRLGLVFDVPRDFAENPVWVGLPALMCRVVRRGALLEPRGARVLTAVAKTNIVLIIQESRIHPDGLQRIIGPAHLMAQVQERVHALTGVRVERVGNELRIERQEVSDGQGA